MATDNSIEGFQQRLDMLSGMSTADVVQNVAEASATQTKADTLRAAKDNKLNALGGKASPFDVRNDYQALSNSYTQMAGDVKESNANKIWNTLTPDEKQQYLGEMSTKGIQRNPDGSMYQVIDGKQVPYKGNVNRLYAYGTKDDPNAIKIGIESGVGDTADARYSNEAAVKAGLRPAAWRSSGPSGVDIQKKYMDMLLPEQYAKEIEGVFHGNADSIKGRSAIGDTAKGAKDKYGGGWSEYYKSPEELFGVSSGQAVDPVLVRKKILDAQRGSEANLTPTVSNSTQSDRGLIANIGRAPQSIAANLAKGVVDLGEAAYTLAGYGVEKATDGKVKFADSTATAKSITDRIDRLVGYNRKIDDASLEKLHQAAEHSGVDITDPKTWGKIFNKETGAAVVELVKNPAASAGMIAGIFGSGLGLGAATKVTAKVAAKVAPKLAENIGEKLALNITKAKEEVSAIRANTMMTEAEKSAAIAKVGDGYTASKKAADFIKGNTLANADFAVRLSNDIEQFKENNNNELPSLEKLATSALLDRVASSSQAMALGKIWNPSTNALTKEAESTIRNGYLKAAKNIGTGVVIEGGQETLDGVIEAINQKYGASKYKDMTLAEVLKASSSDIITGTIAGGIAGGHMAAVAAVKDAGIGGNIANTANSALDKVADYKKNKEAAKETANVQATAAGTAKEQEGHAALDKILYGDIVSEGDEISPEAVTTLDSLIKQYEEYPTVAARAADYKQVIAAVQDPEQPTINKQLVRDNYVKVEATRQQMYKDELPDPQNLAKKALTGGEEAAKRYGADWASLKPSDVDHMAEMAYRVSDAKEWDKVKQTATDLYVAKGIAPEEVVDRISQIEKVAEAKKVLAPSTTNADEVAKQVMTGARGAVTYYNNALIDQVGGNKNSAIANATELSRFHTSQIAKRDVVANTLAKTELTLRTNLRNELLNAGKEGTEEEIRKLAELYKEASMQSTPTDATTISRKRTANQTVNTVYGMNRDGTDALLNIPHSIVYENIANNGATARGEVAGGLTYALLRTLNKEVDALDSLSNALRAKLGLQEEAAVESPVVKKGKVAPQKEEDVVTESKSKEAASEEQVTDTTTKTTSKEPVKATTEYVTSYLDKYKDTELVKGAIKKWQGMDKLVNAIVKQAKKQKGEAWDWWNKFKAWIDRNYKGKPVDESTGKNSTDKTAVKNMLTDSAIRGDDLGETAESKAAPEEQVKVTTPAKEVPAGEKPQQKATEEEYPEGPIYNEDADEVVSSIEEEYRAYQQAEQSDTIEAAPKTIPAKIRASIERQEKQSKELSELNIAAINRLQEQLDKTTDKQVKKRLEEAIEKLKCANK